MPKEKWKDRIISFAGKPIFFIIAFLAMLALIFVPFIMRFFK